MSCGVVWCRVVSWMVDGAMEASMVCRGHHAPGGTAQCACEEPHSSAPPPSREAVGGRGRVKQGQSVLQHVLGGREGERPWGCWASAGGGPGGGGVRG